MFRYIYLYYKRNLKKVIGFIFVVMIGILGCGVLGSIFSSFGDTRVEMTGQTKNWIEVSINGPIDKRELYQRLNTVPQIQKTFEVERLNIGYNIFGASTGSFKLYGVELNDIKDILTLSGVTIKEGEIFKPETNEIMVSQEFLRANGLKVGDIYYEKNQILNRGRYKIVASLEGETLLALGPKGMDNHNITFEAIIAYGDRSVLPRIEDQLKKDLGEYKSSLMVAGPKTTQQNLRQRYMEYFLTILGLNIFVSIVFALGTSMFNVIDFRDRRKEYGIMSVLGKSKSWLYRKLLLEVSFMALIGWILGVLLNMAVVRLLQLWVFSPRGLFINLHVGNIILSLVLPIAVVLSSFLLISRDLRKDMLAFLQGKIQEEKDGSNPIPWRNLSIKELRYPLRTKGYRPMVLSLVVFIVSIIILGMYTSTIETSKIEANRVFDKVTLITLKEEDNNQLLHRIRTVEGVDKIFSGSFFKQRQKLIMGEEEVFIINGSREDIRYISRHLGANNNNFFEKNDILLSSYFAASQGYSSGATMYYKNKAYRVIVDDGIQGSIGFIIDDIDTSGNMKDCIVVIPGTNNLRKTNDDIQSLIYDDSIVEDILSRNNVDERIKKETEFSSSISSILIYLQFFVVMVITLFSSIRLAKGRQGEVATYRIIGLTKKEILKEYYVEGAIIAIMALVLGLIIGLGGWHLLTIITDSLTPLWKTLNIGMILRATILPIIAIAISIGVVLTTIFAKDPVDIIQSR